MNNYKIRTQDICKSYNNDTRLDVLRGINLGIKQGEFLAIQGPSGAGKSTLLHILGGLDSPSKGEVLYDEINIHKLSGNERSVFRNRKIGFVFQFYHLLDELTTLENVLLPGLLKSWWERAKEIKNAKALLERFGLSARLTHRPNQLSGGEQQRVAIARALINRPEVLLCDEPTGNLDSENGINILNLIKQFSKTEHLTVAMVTHDKDITAYADRTIYLKDGALLN